MHDAGMSSTRFEEVFGVRVAGVPHVLLRSHYRRPELQAKPTGGSTSFHVYKHRRSSNNDFWDILCGVFCVLP